MRNGCHARGWVGLGEETDGLFVRVWWALMLQLTWTDTTYRRFRVSWLGVVSDNRCLHSTSFPS